MTLVFDYYLLLFKLYVIHLFFYIMKSIQDFDTYKQTYSKTIETPEQFWADIAASFHWRKKWDKVLEWDFHKPEVNRFLFK
jgi:Acetyl-coenzyme A synthetase N-terminus